MVCTCQFRVIYQHDGRVGPEREERIDDITCPYHHPEGEPPC